MNIGFLGIRTPNKVSTNLPYNKANPRTESKKRPAIGIPIINISKGRDIDNPQIIHVP